MEIILLFQREDAVHTFEGRYWGDPGYIHLCFHIDLMDEWKVHSGLNVNTLKIMKARNREDVPN